MIWILVGRWRAVGVWGTVGVWGAVLRPHMEGVWKGQVAAVVVRAVWVGLDLNWVGYHSWWVGGPGVGVGLRLRQNHLLPPDPCLE